MKASPRSLIHLCRLAGTTAALLTGLLCSPAARAVQPHNPITPADSNGSEEWHSDKRADSNGNESWRSDRPADSGDNDSWHSNRPAAGAPVPEPSAWIMMGTLVAGAAFVAARSRRRATAL